MAYLSTNIERYLSVHAESLVDAIEQAMTDQSAPIEFIFMWQEFCSRVGASDELLQGKLLKHVVLEYQARGLPSGGINYNPIDTRM